MNYYLYTYSCYGKNGYMMHNDSSFFGLCVYLLFNLGYAGTQYTSILLALAIKSIDEY
jgi:hypothetical protein